MVWDLGRQRRKPFPHTRTPIALNLPEAQGHGMLEGRQPGITNNDPGYIMKTPIMSKPLRELRPSCKMMQDVSWKTKELSPEPAMRRWL